MEPSWLVGMSINFDKTKVILQVLRSSINIEESLLEVVKNCLYLEQVIQVGRQNFEK